MNKKDRIKLRKVGYSYHPDFIEDPTEPRGYKILDTGRWVVEWDVSPYHTLGILTKREHFSRSFLTEEEAIEFENKLIHGVDRHGYCITMSKNKQFYLNKD